jgi:PDZ domain-containing protein
MRVLFILLVAFVMAGCASGYQKFYKPRVDARTLRYVELLKPDEEPKVYGTKNFKRDINKLRSKLYIPIGHSSFNGEYEDESKVKAQAKRIGATLVLVNSKYTNTQTTTTPLFFPNSSTTYHSGSVYGSGGYGGYSGTSTTYGSTVVPITTHQRRYDQTAVFFVKSTKKPRFGIFFKNLSNEQRIALERNTGVIIGIVVEESPAFYSNVLPGDILIKVNDSDVRNGKHAHELLGKVSPNANSAVFTVIRKGKEQTITVKFDKN